MGYEARAKAENITRRVVYNERELLMALVNLARRGFWGRMKWLFLGR